nr:ribonuclease H-like domain-containing protein [Tanacetum cinerariifolium]
MTDSTKNMFSVVDVSSLMLTVGHPNGTLAKISAIGSLRLTSGIVLFDVLVVPEYNDLNMGKLVGTGSVTGGLYLFDLDKIGKQTGNNNNNRFNADSGVNHSIHGTSGSISSSFTNKQMVKLLSLINEKPTPAANMS